MTLAPELMPIRAPLTTKKVPPKSQLPPMNLESL